MATRTERVTILTTPEFKEWLYSEAKKNGVSVSELVRLRCQDTKEQLLSHLSAEVNVAIRKAVESIDKGIRDTQETLDELKARREGHRE